ncbi:MAG: G5 domain-containing protein [Armatimonadota bacterium]
MSKEVDLVTLKKQLVVYKVATTFLALILVGSWIHEKISDDKAFVLVNGKPVACLASEKEAHELLRNLKSRSGCNPSEAQFKEDVVIARAPRDAKPVSRHRAENAIRNAISLAIYKWAITVDGKPVVAVPSRSTAGEVLELAKMRFGKLAKNLCEEPQFKEDVAVEYMLVPPNIYKKTPEEAVEYLFNTRDIQHKEDIYTVQSGDVASKIARRFGLTMEELCFLNPNKDLNHLQIGDKIQIKKPVRPSPKLTVIVRDQLERIEQIHPPVHRISSARLYAGKSVEISPGRPGMRKVKIATVYENGHKVGIEVLEEQILKEPIPRQIAEGIKPQP